MKEILSQEMVRWLDWKWSKSNEGCYIPALVCDFRDEFGYKRSKVPDSLSIDMAGRLVRLWLSKKNMKLDHFNGA